MMGARRMWMVPEAAAEKANRLWGGGGGGGLVGGEGPGCVGRR